MIKINKLKERDQDWIRNKMLRDKILKKSRKR